MKKDLIKFGITPKQKKVYDFIKSYIKKHKYSPSYDEIKEANKLSSKSHVRQVIIQLQDRNYITVKYGKSRSVTIL